MTAVLLQKLTGLRTDILKLAIAVGMLLALQVLALLADCSHLMKKLRHLAVADLIPLPLQFISQVTGAFRGPAQQ